MTSINIMLRNNAVIIAVGILEQTFTDLLFGFCRQAAPHLPFSQLGNAQDWKSISVICFIFGEHLWKHAI